MQRLPVESSDLVSVGYDPKRQVLEVEFRGQRIYEYLDVEPALYDQLLRAESYGDFFDAHIKRRYRYKKAKGPDDVGAQPATRPLAFVTGNERKFHYFQRACAPYDIPVEQVRLPVGEIQSHDPKAVAVHKAKEAYRLAGNRPVVVDDHFWNILALRGFPGAFMAYVAEWFKVEDFLALLADKQDRSVCRTETLVYYDGKLTKVWTKDRWGTILTEPRGIGLPIDRLVVMQGQDKTMAELEDAEGRSSYDPTQEGVQHDFALWYKMQLRILSRSIPK